MSRTYLHSSNSPRLGGYASTPFITYGNYHSLLHPVTASDQPFSPYTPPVNFILAPLVASTTILAPRRCLAQRTSLLAYHVSSSPFNRPFISSQDRSRQEVWMFASARPGPCRVCTPVPFPFPPSIRVKPHIFSPPLSVSYQPLSGTTSSSHLISFPNNNMCYRSWPTCGHQPDKQPPSLS